MGIKKLWNKNKNKLLHIVARGSDISGIIAIVTVLFGVNIAIAIPTSIFFFILGLGVSFLIEIAPDNIEHLRYYINKRFGNNDSIDDIDASSLYAIQGDLETILSRTSRTNPFTDIESIHHQRYSSE